MRPISFLDSREDMAKLDKSNMLGSIEQFGQQVDHVWQQVSQLEFDSSYRDVTSIVVAGMGGSALGAHVIQTLFKDELKIPLILCPDYTLPEFVGANTLVIASSYSGTTEETVAALKHAIAKGAKVTGITIGGELGQILTDHNLPGLIFDPKHNPCNSPRMALGYSIFGQIGLLGKIGLLDVQQHHVEAVLNTIAAMQIKNSVDTSQDKNQAKIIAFHLVEKIPVLIAAEHLEGVVHVCANQLNENAKTYSEYRVVPELNHHLMEGLMFPKSAPSLLSFLTVRSDLYSKQNGLRMDLTQQVIQQNEHEFQTINLESETKLEQVFELMVINSYVGFYISMLNDIDPTPIPFVDWFKDQLKARGSS